MKSFVGDRVGNLVAACAICSADEDEDAEIGRASLFIESLTEDEAKDALSIGVGLLTHIFEAQAMEDGVDITHILQTVATDLVTLCETDL